MFKFNKLLLKLLSLLIIFISTNSYAEDEKIVQNIEELRSAGYEIKSLELENSFWYINLEKKAEAKLQPAKQIFSFLNPNILLIEEKQ